MGTGVGGGGWGGVGWGGEGGRRKDEKIVSNHFTNFNTFTKQNSNNNNNNN